MGESITKLIKLSVLSRFDISFCRLNKVFGNKAGLGLLDAYPLFVDNRLTGPVVLAFKPSDPVILEFASNWGCLTNKSRNTQHFFDCNLSFVDYVFITNQ